MTDPSPEHETITWFRNQLEDALAEPRDVVRAEILDNLNQIPAFQKIRADILGKLSPHDTTKAGGAYQAGVTAPWIRQGIESAFALGVIVSAKVASGWWPKDGFEYTPPPKGPGR